MLQPISRPSPAEHAAWAITYIDATAAALASSGLSDVRDLLSAQPAQLDTLLAGVSDADADRGYAPGKWSLKASLVHVVDTERVFAYRMMRVARGDRTPLPGFEQDEWVPESRAERRTLQDIVAELRAVRAANIALVMSLDDTAFAQVGTASGNPITPRALAWMITGHMAHHFGILRDRYLPALHA
jgi:hypothetical protein